MFSPRENRDRESFLVDLEESLPPLPNLSKRLLKTLADHVKRNPSFAVVKNAWLYEFSKVLKAQELKQMELVVSQLEELKDHKGFNWSMILMIFEVQSNA